MDTKNELVNLQVHDIMKKGEIDSWSKLQAYERERMRKEANKKELDDWLSLGIDSWSKLQAHERERLRKEESD